MYSIAHHPWASSKEKAPLGWKAYMSANTCCIIAVKGADRTSGGGGGPDRPSPNPRSQPGRTRVLETVRFILFSFYFRQNREILTHKEPHD